MMSNSNYSRKIAYNV